jgi:serine/threonine-protein kinase
VLIVSVVLIALGYWTYTAVASSLRELRAAALTAMLEAQVRTLGIWIENHKIDIRRIARDPQVRDAVQALAAIASRPGAGAEDYCSAPARQPLVAQLTALLEEEGAASFNAVDRSQRIIAARFREDCGRQATKRDFGPVFGGETRFLVGEQDAKRMLWTDTPVRTASGEIIAALGFGEYAQGRFAAILAAGASGQTGEAYAFDGRGTLLTGGRFGSGVTPLPAKGSDGVVLDPYPSYHGGPVIGAWRWVPQYDLGVAVEMGATEAYAPLRYLNIAFGLVFGALVIAVLAAAASALSVIRLRREIGDGRKLGAYALEKVIGEGGVATVYRARHDLLRRPAAVKLLKPARATDEMIARFEREVQMASSLAHPNTVEIFDYGRTRDGLFYYAMEYLDGLTVGEIVARHGAVPVPRTIHILRQVCAALGEAHGKGIIHRDIKPENIMVCRYGGVYDHVKILDFGLVKHVAGKHSRDLTRSLRILGTPLYMAPERLRNPADVDARVDIYALGAVAFLMLTGKKLFESADDLQLTSRILNDEPRRASEEAAQPIPVELDLLVLSCVEKRREERPQRIADLLEAFDALALEHRWTQAAAELWWSSLSNPNK